MAHSRIARGAAPPSQPALSKTEVDKTKAIAYVPTKVVSRMGGGSNITLIGSTANIVALGMLEKQARVHVRFLEWMKIGLASAIITCALAAGAIMLLKARMPETPAAAHAQVEHTQVEQAAF